ncbi:uncharacterized protein EMH_0066870 [Eimeria mitis]|uniref:Cytadherence high molecular weight protein 2, related n=1 Tax=Eimeria mitis TaxID=44415 RepID=U6K544_9EIME|nr:uncharacterized protein EMH_0066870 [Eimeria mitis]CDJ31447.1 hypothetical protein EMH_0066870 [Eimeria mitis]
MNIARGELVVVDSTGGRISTIHLTTGVLTDIKTGVTQPEGVAVSDDGNTLYVSQSAAGKVVAINLNEKTESDLVSGLSSPAGLCLSLDGATLYVAEAAANKVSSINIRTQTKTDVVGQGATADIELNNPRAVAVSLDGEIYVADGNSGNSRPTLFLADSTKHIIWKLDLQTHRLEQILGTGTKGFTGDGRIIPAPEAAIDSPTGVAVADQGQGQPEVTGRCADGYYCPEGSAKTNAVACPPGHFCKALESKSVQVKPVQAAAASTSAPAEPDCPLLRASPKMLRRRTSLGILSSFSVHYFHSASSTYVELFSVTSNKESTYSLNFGEVATRKIMLTTSDSQVYLSEIQVSGTSSPGPAAPTPCPKGWYQDLKAQTACKICPEGYFCEDSTVTPSSKCPPGYYCPKGSYNGHEYPCPLGTYNKLGGAKGASECLPCPVGKYCGSRGLEEPTGECLAGYYCKGGAWSPAPHPDEKNPDGIPGSAGSLCPIGYYCQEGAESPEPCQEGTSSSVAGGKAQSDCLPCQPGQYCSSTMGTGLCAEGYYCSGGSTTATPTDNTHGNVCPAGYYCPEGSYVAQVGLFATMPGSLALLHYVLVASSVPVELARIYCRYMYLARTATNTGCVPLVTTAHLGPLRRHLVLVGPSRCEFPFYTPPASLLFGAKNLIKLRHEALSMLWSLPWLRMELVHWTAKPVVQDMHAQKKA